MLYYLDGNNICYWGQERKFSLTPLLNVCEALSELGHKYVCFFDASVKRKVKGAAEKEVVKKMLSDPTRFRVVPSGTDADDFIVMSADGDNASIVSNDFYRELHTQYPWLDKDHQPNRLLKGSVFPDTIGEKLMIPSLAINKKMVDDLNLLCTKLNLQSSSNGQGAGVKGTKKRQTSFTQTKHSNNKKTQRMSDSNSKQWSSAHPGYIIFLIDQSGSMIEPYSSGNTKAEYTASVVNRTIYEIINANMTGETVKDRVFISLIGYGGTGSLSVDDLRSEYLSVFADNPLRVNSVKKKIPDGAGGLVEIQQDMPIFLEATTNGLTPMAEAMEFAKELIEAWLNKKPDNPAPVIINISDGLPFVGDTVESAMNKAISVANEIMSINSSDGPPLIFNAHIGDSTAAKCAFEESENQLPDDQAKFLFKISSKIPESYKAAASKHEFTVRPESRGFVSNADPELFVNFINFGSSGGKDKVA